MSRGGPQNLGMKLSSNTSGLNAIRFRRRDGATGALVYVDAAAGAARITRSLGQRGDRRDVLRDVLKRRRQAGYPVPSLAEAEAALQRWLRRNPC